MTTIMDLDDGSLGTVLDFLPGHFRFAASVNRRFRFLYVIHNTQDTFYTTAMSSVTTRNVWLEEDEMNVRTNACRFAAKYANWEALQWFRSRDCRWDISVCEEAAGRGHLHLSLIHI